jgi:hypothetical protein
MIQDTSAVNLTPSEPEVQSPTKASPKRYAPKTITAFSIERFQPPEQHQREQASVQADKKTTKTTTGKRKKAATSPSKSSTSKSAKRAAELKKPKLLSPTSAGLRLAHQDVLFGTSSQLAVETSSSLRDLQAALHASERESMARSSHRIFRSRVKGATSDGMWGVDSLLSDDNPFVFEVRREASGLSVEENVVEVLDTSAEWQDIDGIDVDANRLSSPPVEAAVALDSVSVGLRASSANPRELDPVESFSSVTTVCSVPARRPSPHRQPSRLSSSISTLPRKSVAMSRKSPDSMSPIKRPKRAASKIKKKTTASKAQAEEHDDEFEPIDEIMDPEPNLTPSPPRLPPITSPLALGSSHDVLPITSKHLRYATRPDWNDIKLELYPRVTQLLKSLPPSMDPSNRNWYEKMLMYDPIVIEELCSWLNEQGLVVPAPGKAGERGETKQLSGWMVRNWCEEHSICCVWREGTGQWK